MTTPQNTGAKIALVTGANKGIGYELVRHLARAGVQTVLTARDSSRGQAAVERLAGGGLSVAFLPLDVTDPHSVAALARELGERYGRLDMLVNNAGIFSDAAETPLTLTAEALYRVLDTNTLGPLRVTQALAPLLRQGSSPRVLNVSSGLGQLVDMEADYPAYSISKTALNAVTRQLAAALAPAVTVNALCPGWVRTDMGGPNAERSTEQSVAGILPLLLDEADRRTGCFLRDGREIPW